jgi:hypothetical protein
MKLVQIKNGCTLRPVVASLLIIIGFIVFFMSRKNTVTVTEAPTKTPQKIDHVTLLLNAISPTKENYTVSDDSVSDDSVAVAVVNAGPRLYTIEDTINTDGSKKNGAVTEIKNGMNAFNVIYNDFTGKNIEVPRDTITTVDQFDQFNRKLADDSMFAMVDIFNTVTNPTKYDTEFIYREIGGLFIALMTMLAVPTKTLSVKKYYEGERITRVDIISLSGENLILSKIKEIAAVVGSLESSPAVPTFPLPSGITAYPSVVATKYLASLSATNCSPADLCVARQMCNKLSNLKDISIEDVGKLTLLMFYTSRFVR